MASGSYVPKPKDLSQQKMRTCLKCSQEFLSMGPGNRICPECNIKNSKKTSSGKERTKRMRGSKGTRAI
jgi:uncharacterized Zn ribbon protein